MSKIKRLTPVSFHVISSSDFIACNNHLKKEWKEMKCFADDHKWTDTVQNAFPNTFKNFEQITFKTWHSSIFM